MDEILGAGLDLLLERHAKAKGVVKEPLPEPRPSKPGHVAARRVFGDPWMDRYTRGRPAQSDADPRLPAT